MLTAKCTRELANSSSMPHVGSIIELVRSMSKPEYKRDDLHHMAYANERLVQAFCWRYYGIRVAPEDIGNDVSLLQKKNNFGMKMFYKELTAVLNACNNRVFKNKILALMLRHRYLDARFLLPRSMEWLTTVLPASPDCMFEQVTRMIRSYFGQVVHILETKAFSFLQNNSINPQLPVPIQLHVGLFSLVFVVMERTSNRPG